MSGNDQPKLEDPSFPSLGPVRNKIVIALIALVAADVILTLFVYPEEGRTVITNITVTITSGVAFVLAAIVVFRQKTSGLYGKTYLAFALGIGCWFAGEVIWSYYETISGIELPELSAADALWILGYVFFGYFLFGTYRFFSKMIKHTTVLLVALAVGIVITNAIQALAHSTEFFSDDILLSITRAAYPIGSGVLLVPSILMLTIFRNGKLTSTSWILLSVGILITAIADSTFTFITLLDNAEIEWLANLLYDASYLSMAAALLWYNKFMVYDRAAATKQWQEKNK